MLFTLIFCITLLHSVNAITILNRTFAIHAEYSDVMYGDGLILNTTLHSLIVCAHFCGIQSCLSFSYSNKTGACLTYTTSFPLCDPTPLANQPSTGSLPFYRELDYQQRFCPCNLDLTDGTWTVMHQRFDGSVDFLKDWASYKKGFGNSPNGEFWLGLEPVHQLTKNKEFVLMIDLVDFGDIRKCAYFGNFSIAPEADNYRLTVGDYIGNGGDSMSYHDGMQFSTTDRDNDKRDIGSCVDAFSGPGWLNDCLSQNLNGEYGDNDAPQYMCYRAFRNFKGLKKAKMLIKEKGT